MVNKKVNLSKAVETLTQHFMRGGAATTCKKTPKTGNCSINGTGLRPEWCELGANTTCITSTVGKQHIDSVANNVFRRINYYDNQGQQSLKTLLNTSTNMELQAICRLLDISTTGVKKILVERLLKHRVWSVLQGSKILSFTSVGDN